jgi:DNA-binding CsgD family transcriptional regulator
MVPLEDANVTALPRITAMHTVAARPAALRPAFSVVDGGAADRPSRNLAGVLEAMPTAAAIVAADDRILAANERFADLDVLRGLGGRLSAHGGENAAELRRLLLEARASASVGGRAVAKAVFRGADDDRPVFATARPCAAGTGPADAILIMVDDLARPSRADLGQAFRLLGLTRGEARVAATVGSGLSPREAAEAIGCAEQSVRSVLKTVFAKLGIHKQSELGRIVVRMEAMAAA